MSTNQLHLLRSRRFLPLFATQALGALNDNVFKNALVVLIIYRLAEAANLNGQILVTAAAGIFILPFFLFPRPLARSPTSSKNRDSSVGSRPPKSPSWFWPPWDSGRGMFIS